MDRLNRHTAKIYNLLAIGLVLIGFALRIQGLTSVPLNRDEYRTILLFVRLPLPEIFMEFNSNNHPMAAALAHLLSPQGDHLYMLRWSAVLVGMLSLPFIFRLGTMCFDRRVGLLALLLFGFSYVHLSYSIFVRGYIGLITMTLISAYFLWRALQNNRWADWLLFVAANIIIIFFHLFGVLSTWAQIGLAGLWLIYNQVKNRNQTQKLVRLIVAAILIAAVHLPFVIIRTTSVLDEGGYAADFNVWSNGQFSVSDEVSPLVHFVTLMGPMSPGGIGTLLYLLFIGIGLVALWRHQAIFALMAAIWFIGPFIGVFIGMVLVGNSFYVYTRFLLYLMPSYLLLVAYGLVTGVDWLEQWGQTQPNRKPLAQVAIFGGFAALLIVQAISVLWYKQTSSNTDWQAIAATIAAQKQPQDIVICDEDQGFDVPDRAKAYCVWMMDVLVPGLEEYTYPLQSSTSIVADYDYLREYQQAMLNPGGVWLVVWHRGVIIYPDYFDATQPPPVTEWPPAAAFEPYEFKQVGAATLVHINTADTLFDNLYQAVELLARFEDSAADKARYYRSLAEMNAFRGDAQMARKFLKQSRQEVDRAGGQYSDLFLMETRPTIERIPPSESPSASATAANFNIAPNLCLKAYQISPLQLVDEQPLSITFFWRADGPIAADYKMFLQLLDQTGETRGRFEFDPFDRTYPTPWWWPDQNLTEQREFTVPAELPVQPYTVLLGSVDRNDQGHETIHPLFRLLPTEDSSTVWQIDSISTTEIQCELNH